MKQKKFQKKFATLAARAVFVCPMSLLFAHKTVNFVPKTGIFDKILNIFPAKHDNSKW